MSKHIAIIGAGIAGITAAKTLTERGHRVSVIEKQDKAGGHVAGWDRLFPYGRKASELTKELFEGFDNSNLICGQSIQKIEKSGNLHHLTLSDSREIEADAVLLASGFSMFEARLKEEYGYGIYNNVFTSKDLEQMFIQDKVLTEQGTEPQRIGFVHCVGSRDEKVGNRYCSKLCCATAVKQASEIKQMYPNAEVYCFYMDLRMFELPYEQMYFDAQTKYGVRFVRGRLCEAAQTIDDKVAIKVEDTLAGKTLNMSVDMLVLMSGMTPSSDSSKITSMLGLSTTKEGFVSVEDYYLRPNGTQVDGVFVAGTCSGPKNIPQTIADARSAASIIDQYLAQG